MTRPRCVITCAALLAIPAFASAQTIDDPAVPVTPHASGFSQPTGIEFLGRSPTDFFIIEKNSGLVKRSNNGVVSTALDLAVAGAPERGLLGIAKSPSFATDNLVYLYYSRTTGGDGGTWDANVLSRYTWNGTNLIPDATFTTKTFGTAADGQTQGPNHNAGPITFGPDGKLYGITGDLNRNFAEQNNLGTPNSSSKVGGIYRFNADGSLPADNPFIGNANVDFRQWYAYGIRNSFGITFDPLTGALWDTENGPASFDEINRVNPGTNSGWNKIMGPDSRDPQNVSDLVSLPGSSYSDPEFSWTTPIAPTSLAFLANSTMDFGYRDAVLVGDTNTGQIYLFRLNANRDGFVLSGALADLVADWDGGNLAERDANKFGQGFGVSTEITVGPDGGVYLTNIGSGAVSRIGGKSWKLDGNGDWEDAPNWQGGAPGIAEFANFFETISAPRTVTYDDPKSLAGVTFNSAHRYTITGAPPFALSNGATTVHLRVLQGSHTIATPVTLSSNTSIDIFPANSVMTISGAITASTVTITKNGAGTIEAAALRRSSAPISPSLVINAGAFRIIANGTNSGTSIFTSLTVNGGKLDLTNNDLILTGMTRAAVEALVDAGFGPAENWLGSGITSSTAAAAVPANATSLGVADNAEIGYTTFSGQTVNASSILVKYTWTGDSTLDGVVDPDDFNQFVFGFSFGGPARWLNGDYNYDQVVDPDDFNLFLAGFNAFNASGGMPLSEDFRAELASFASEHGLPLLLDPVPEPQAIGAAMLALGMLLTRQRR